MNNGSITSPTLPPLSLPNVNGDGGGSGDQAAMAPPPYDEGGGSGGGIVLADAAAVAAAASSASHAPHGQEWISLSFTLSLSTPFPIPSILEILSCFVLLLVIGMLFGSDLPFRGQLSVVFTKKSHDSRVWEGNRCILAAFPHFILICDERSSFRNAGKLTN